MLLTADRDYEEWPSEQWNFQDNYGTTIDKVKARSNPTPSPDEEAQAQKPTIDLDPSAIKKILTSVEGIGNKKAEHIANRFDTAELISILEDGADKLVEEFGWFKKKMSKQMGEVWSEFKAKLS
jgi:hypothetical protein